MLVAGLALTGCAPHCDATGVRLDLTTRPWFVAHPGSGLEVCLDDRCVQADPGDEQVMSVAPAEDAAGGQPRRYLVRISLTQQGTEVATARGHVTMERAPATTGGCPDGPAWIASAKLTARGELRTG